MLFDYKAKTIEGKTVKGSIDAPSEELAVDNLTKQGLILLSLVEHGKGLKLSMDIRIGSGVKSKDMVLFSRQLSVMISAGLPLMRALTVLAEQTSNRYFKNVITEITDDVRGGTRFSSALAKYPKIFNDFFINMIRAGETSGKLDEILNYLADEQEKNYDLASKIKGAMIYPIFIFVAMLGIMFLMMTMVIPKLTAVLTEAGVELPLPTKILIATSNFLSAYWYILILALIILIISFRLFLKTRPGRFIWDSTKLKLPVFGGLLQRIYLVRFTRSMSTLLIGGVPLTSGLRIVADVVGNVIYKNIILDTVEAVEGGNSISSVFIESTIIPKMLSHIMAVGEQTGQLDTVLDKMANFYAREVENMLGKLTVLIEPVIIIILGIAVGGIVASILLPMYNLATAI